MDLKRENNQEIEESTIWLVDDQHLFGAKNKKHMVYVSEIIDHDHIRCFIITSKKSTQDNSWAQYEQIKISKNKISYMNVSQPVTLNIAYLEHQIIPDLY